MKIAIVPNDNPKEHKDRRGRVHVSRKRTWVVLLNGEAHGEYRTRREAKIAAQLWRQAAPSLASKLGE